MINLWSAALVFPAFIVLRLVATRVYASGVLSAVQRGAVSEEQLGEFEWEALHRLDLLHLKPAPHRHALARFMTWASSRAGRLTGYGVLAFVWFTFVAQIFISEFFHYHPREGWLNQPLVQLPWFHYIPPNL